MKVLVTGSSGHLGEALVIKLIEQGHEVIGVDLLPSRHTHVIGSIVDKEFVYQIMEGIDWVFHAATLHKPHIVSHTKQQFVDVNISGTLNLLEASVKHNVKSFIFTSSTSVFGKAMTPRQNEPAVWINESVVEVPRNIYGVTKKAAEDLCQLFSSDYGLPCVILRTSRFFLEVDDEDDMLYSNDNLKVIEYIHRRVEISDAVDAHLLAVEAAPLLRFRRYVISATTPFTREDALALRTDVSSVLMKYFPKYQSVFAKLEWKMFPGIDRIYDNNLARVELGWAPKFSFQTIVDLLDTYNEGNFQISSLSELSSVTGAKGYHRTA